MRVRRTRFETDTINWLLEKDNPSVRYFTLKDILNKSENHPEVIKAKAQIMAIGAVPKILSAQHQDGYWGKPEDFYVRAKYKGTVWSFILLAQLGADGNDKRIKKAGEFILTYSQDRQSGGFCYHGTKANGGNHNAVIPCLTGNMAWCLTKFGYLNDPRVKKAINWITTYQRFDDGVKGKDKNLAPTGWPYDKKDNGGGYHPCHNGVVKNLKALAEIPKGQRTAEVNNTVLVKLKIDFFEVLT
jgi:hypothetical protein